MLNQAHTTPIRSALISVYHKEGLDPIVKELDRLGVIIYSTGGTETYLKSRGYDVISVEKITGYPSILGGRVKTLHPKIFGGILYRRNHTLDKEELKKHAIPFVDLVIVDLYPFEATVASGCSHEDIIEKIDIGGIALIRAAAKNYHDTLVVSSMKYYHDLLDLLKNNHGNTTIKDRKLFATRSFETSSHYDTHIYQYMAVDQQVDAFKISASPPKTLRYGENPHQKGFFYGDISKYIEQIHGKPISYNNLIDIEAAIQLITEFGDNTFAILKHNNACGVASAPTVAKAYQKAYESDTLSAYGGILIANREIDEPAAEKMDSLFYEILIAPSFTKKALEIIQKKKNRILLIQKQLWTEQIQYRSLLNGVIVQDVDSPVDSYENVEIKTHAMPSQEQMQDLIFADKISKQTKSNAIVLVKNKQLLTSGMGQTSRVDALKQAIQKASVFGMNLEGGVMASEAFFPFLDCVKMAHRVGITSVIQPGGSKNDQLSIDYCNKHAISMVFTGKRHFKH